MDCNIMFGFGFHHGDVIFLGASGSFVDFQGS